MDQFIVKIRVSKAEKPDTFMTANRTVASPSIAGVINRLTVELEKMSPVAEKADA